jgi:hypothetical protein
MKLSDYLNAINDTKVNLFAENRDDLTVEKEYSPYIINRCMSYFPDTIFQVNQINRFGDVPKEHHFMFLSGIIPKRKRFSKWIKKEKFDDIDLVKQVFGYSTKRAEEVVSLLSKEQLQEMRNSLYTGGVKSK